MSFRPIGSANAASLPAKPAAPASPKADGEPAATPTSASSVQGPQIPAQLQQSATTTTTASQAQYYPGYAAVPAAAYSPTTGYTSTAVAGPSYDPSAYTGYAGYAGYDAAAAGAYPGYDAYSAYAGASSGYDYSASGYGYGASSSAGPSGGYQMTDEELAAQQSAYNPENVQQQEGKPKKVRGQARTTVLRKGAGEVWEDATLMDWDPKHFRLFIGDLGNDVNDEDLVKAFGPDKGWTSFQKAKVVRDKVTGKTRGYGFVSYSDPEDFMAAWKAMNGKYVGSRPVKIQKASTTVRQVNIGEKKAKELDTKKKAHVVGNKVRGAINPTGAWKPYIRR